MHREALVKAATAGMEPARLAIVQALLGVGPLQPITMALQQTVLTGATGPSGAPVRPPSPSATAAAAGAGSPTHAAGAGAGSADASPTHACDLSVAEAVGCAPLVVTDVTHFGGARAVVEGIMKLGKHRRVVKPGSAASGAAEDRLWSDATPLFAAAAAAHGAPASPPTDAASRTGAGSRGMGS